MEAPILNLNTVYLKSFNTTLRPKRIFYYIRTSIRNMILKYFLIIISLSILGVASSHSKIERNRSKILTKLVEDLTGNEKVPSTLWAKTCWTKFEKFNFIKSVSIPIQMAGSAVSIDLPSDENINKQWFFIDINCGEQSVKLLSITDRKYFAHPFRWIIVDGTLDSIKNLTFLPDSNIILANWDNKSKKYILKQGDKK